MMTDYPRERRIAGGTFNVALTAEESNQFATELRGSMMWASHLELHAKIDVAVLCLPNDRSVADEYLNLMDAHRQEDDFLASFARAWCENELPQIREAAKKQAEQAE